MATIVLTRGVLLFFALTLHLSIATCALLQRNQHNAKAQCANDTILTIFKAQSNSRSFCSAYLADAVASDAIPSVRYLYTVELEVKSMQRLMLMR